MKLVRFQDDSQAYYGVLTDDTIEILAGPPFDGIERSARTAGLAGVKLLAPVVPPNIIAIGLNYRKHAEESGQALPEIPLLFLKAPTAAIGPEEPIVLPAMAPGKVDLEGEIAIVIGKKAKNVSVDEAPGYIIGCTCGNDVSARDCQLEIDGQWARGKSFDTFAPIGPWIETEINGDDCPLRSSINHGQPKTVDRATRSREGWHVQAELGRGARTVMQESNTSDRIFNNAELVSFLSKCMTLLPGTVIMTGTPSGIGYARDPQVVLRPGDIAESEIGGIGTLRNPVVAETA